MNPSQHGGIVSFPLEISFASDEPHRVRGS